MPNPHHCKAATLLLLVAAALLTLPAQAIIIKGKVTTPFGVPLGNARIQLIQGKQAIAFGVSQLDGTYEIRSTAVGQFVLITAAAPYTPNIGEHFYGARTAVITRNIVMQYLTIDPQLAKTFSGIPTPTQQVPSGITLIPQSALITQIGIANDLRQSPGTNVVQTGQAGGPIALSIRGGSSDANKVLTDSIPSEDIGGNFNFSPVSTASLTGPELYRGPNSALYGAGAEAGIVAFATTRSAAIRPTLNYTGDAGNFHTYRNEATFSGAYKRLDYLAVFSRFDTSNALPLDQYHSTNEIANIGYSILTNTTARFTLRNTVSATGLPGAHDIYGISSSGKQSDQDLYSAFTVENIFAGNWHNLARYGIARKREQVEQFAPTGQPVTTITNGTQQTTYFGNPIIIHGANGYTATGQAAFILPAFDSVSNRDQFDYQTDYTFPYRIATLFSFHYENERGRLLDFASPQGQVIIGVIGPEPTNEIRRSNRTNYLYTVQVQSDIKHRLFYFGGGSVEDNQLLGILGTPRLGLTYDAIRPGHKPFHGTNLHAYIATGTQEPSLTAQLTSLSTLLQQTGNSTFNIAPIAAERSRTYDFSVDQNILNQKLTLKAGYFRNQFNHQLEFIGPAGLEHYFNIPASIATQIPAASLNSLAYHTQGLELEVQSQPFSHLFLHGGYTYLASIVQQSFTSDNAAPVINPNIPGVPIGALSPLVGSRPFQRPPNTGFFAAQFTSSRFSAAIKGAFSSRSDDSTFQLNNDRHGANTLLLPNRDLDFGYAKLDLNLLFPASNHFTFFTQLDNLLGQQHIGPIGYPGLPFTIRAGMKIKIFGD